MTYKVRGIFRNGVAEVLGPVPEGAGEFVMIDFDKAEPTQDSPRLNVLGMWKGKFSIKDDFDEPLDEMLEYMY